MGNFHFTFEPDWRRAPLAFWVHIPVAGDAVLFDPPAPAIVPHKGYPVLHVPFGSHELLFSSGAQLAHCIAVLSSKPLPTSRQLSAQRGLPVGPYGHWLSRLPAALKAPHKRMKLVETLQLAWEFAAEEAPNHAFMRPDEVKPAPHPAGNGSM